MFYLALVVLCLGLLALRHHLMEKQKKHHVLKLARQNALVHETGMSDKEIEKYLDKLRQDGYHIVVSYDGNQESGGNS